MKFVLASIVFVSFAIANAAQNSAVGVWYSGPLKAQISETSLQLNGQCSNGETFQIAVGIQLSADSITVLEDKEFASGDCAVSFTKGTVLPYSVQNGQLVVVSEGQHLVFQSAPAAQTAPSELFIKLFATTNCQGNAVEYFIGMDCSQLAGTVMSLEVVGTNGVCQKTNSAMSVRSVCESLNSQLGN